MAAQSLEVQLLTPTKALLKTSARHVNAPGAYGYIGILPDHTPLISELKAGVLKIEGGETGKTLSYRIPGGFVEVAHNHVTLLVDAAEPIVEA